MENSLAGLIELAPDLTDDLLTHVDQPLKIQRDTKTGKMFVLCDYNRDGDSYRSPWSNEYFPPMEDDGFFPSDSLRDMEVQANALFDVYRKLYYEGGYSSVYFFDTDTNASDARNFGATFLVHKDVEGERGLKGGWWDSIHVFEVKEQKKGSFEYKLTSTVMVSMLQESDKTGEVDLSGSMTQQETQVKNVDTVNNHLTNLGTMLEAMELKIRNAIEGIYIQKTREVLNGIRVVNAEQAQVAAQLAKDLQEAMAKGHKD